MNKFDNFKTQKAYELDYLIAQKAYELDCLRSYRDIIDHHYVKNAMHPRVKRWSHRTDI